MDACISNIWCSQRGKICHRCRTPFHWSSCKATVRRGQVVVELQTSPDIDGIHIRVDFYWFPLASWNICHKFSQFQINWINLEFTGTPWLNGPILLPYCSHKKSLFLMEKMEPCLCQCHLSQHYMLNCFCFCLEKWLESALIGYPSHNTWVAPEAIQAYPRNMTWWKICHSSWIFPGLSLHYPEDFPLSHVWWHRRVNHQQIKPCGFQVPVKSDMDWHGTCATKTVLTW